jgi:glutamate 5-kinase
MKSNRRRIVVKLGTQVVMDDDGSLATPRIARLVQQIAEAKNQGHEMIVISSGAVGLGRTEFGSKSLGRSTQKKEPAQVLAEKQACAAVGQSLLMESYRRLFENSGPASLKVAQLLVTAQDFADRVHYLNLRRTLEMILQLGAIPIINENDPVSVSEILGSEQAQSFGYNDALSALVASKIGADLLILLTNVDAVYTENPKMIKNAKRIESIRDWTQLATITTQGISTDGRGGMSSKLHAARLASKAGVRVVIASGFVDGIVSRAITSESIPADFGTWIEPSTKQLSQRELWIGGASGYKGQLTINEGAAKALREKNASLLVAGIVKVSGQFERGQVIRVSDVQNFEIGRGVSRWEARELQRFAGLSRTELEAQGIEKRSIVIHRDDFVLSELSLEHKEAP